MRATLLAVLCLASLSGASAIGSVPEAMAARSAGTATEYVTSEGSLTHERVGPDRARIRVLVVSGPNAHICEFDEVLTIKGSTAVFTEAEFDGSETCKLTFRFAKDAVEVDQEGSCGCGVQANMEGTYLARGSFKGEAPHPAKGAALKRLASAERDEAEALKRVETTYLGPSFKGLRDRLSTAERAWRTFREADAAFEADQARGTPWGEVLALAKREEASSSRAKHLEAVLHQESSDIEVPRPADAQGRLKASDDRLNQMYRSLRGRLDPEGQKTLLAAQRAWIRYRDAQCAFETERWAQDREGFEAMCLARLTEERYDHLKNWFQACDAR